jgi:cell division protein FtsB
LQEELEAQKAENAALQQQLADLKKTGAAAGIGE